MDFIEKAVARDPSLGLEGADPVDLSRDAFEHRVPRGRQRSAKSSQQNAPRPAPQRAPPPPPVPIQRSGDEAYGYGYGYGYIPPEGAVTGGAEPDLKEIFAALWRGKWFILGLTLAATVLTAVVVWQLSPRYTAESRVLVSPGEANVVNLQNVIAGLPGDRETIGSQVEVIRSREIAEKAIERYGIQRLEPSGDGGPGLLERVADLVPTSWSELFSRAETQPRSSGGTKPKDIGRQRLVDELIGSVNVYRQAGTRVIVIKYESADPETSATIADAFADLYIESQRQTKLTATREASAWLKERVAAVRQQVQASEAAVEEYRRRTGLVEGQTAGVTLGSQQMSQLSTALVAAQDQRMEAEARSQQIDGLIQSGADAAALQDVMASPVIGRLLERKVELELGIAELNRKFTSNHPDIGRQRLELRDVRGQIGAEVKKTANRLKEELGIAQARETSLKNRLDSMTSEVADSNTDKVRLRDLQREAEANRTLLETLLTRLKETKSQDDIAIQKPDARILSRATIPDAGSPTFPNSNLLIVLAFLGSAMAGLVLTFLRHILEPGFRSAEQIERILGLSTLSLVPMLTGTSKYLTTPIHYISKRPRSALAESIRFLNANVRLGLSSGYSPKSVLLTSAQPSEGKTSIVLAMAQERAMSGFSTVVIDADLRRGSVGEVLNLDSKVGLAQILSGEATLEEALQHVSSGIEVIPTGEVSISNVADMLSSKIMDNMLETLTNQYDMVLIDAPPVMVGADALILHSKTDATLFVIRWADTHRKFAKLAVKRLAERGDEVAGAVLSMVNIKAHSSYGYADSGYYAGRLKKYYSN